jgi:glycerol-3-phosphate dehydrogenase
VAEYRGLDRGEHLRRIRGQHFQVLVIGGGITGAGVAWDCALRGLSVALLERTDFAAGTSSVSSKMVHAGLRYMVNDPGLVAEASLERRRLLAAGPQLAWPMEFLLPAYADSPEYGAEALPGILARYDELAGRRNTAPGRMLDPSRVLSEIPALRSSPLAVGSYWDGLMDDARLTLEVVHSAAAAGAAVANHAPVIGFLEDSTGRVIGARFREEDPGGPGGEHQVTADAVVSAAGVFTDLLLGLAGSQKPALRPSKGIHVVVRSDATAGKALVLPVGGNVLYFLVPFRPGYLAMGCTDTDYPVGSYADLDHLATTDGELEFTLGLLDRLLPGVFDAGQVVACYAGVRPLLAPPSGSSLSESATSRTHRIWQAPGGIWTIAGGKYTTFRIMAEQLVDRVVQELRSRFPTLRTRPCRTAESAYHGAPVLGDGKPARGAPGSPSSDPVAAFDAWLEREAARLGGLAGLPPDCCRHLCRAYGTSAAEVASLVRQDPALGGRIAAGRPFVRAEIRWAAEREMCRSAADFLVRRTQLRFLERQGLDALEAVVDGLAGCLGWSAEVRSRQAEEYRQYIRRVTPPSLR